MRDFLGAPILNVPGRGYFYDPTAGRFELPGLWFRRNELEALLVMEHLLACVQPGLLSLYINPLRDKLNAILNAGVTGHQPFPSHRIRILRAHARTVQQTQFVPVATAVVEQRQFAFTYAGRAVGTTAHRTVSPQRLVYCRDQWYLDGWDEGKHALRTFAIDRMGEAGIPDRLGVRAIRRGAGTIRTLTQPLIQGFQRRVAKLPHSQGEHLPILGIIQGVFSQVQGKKAAHGRSKAL